MGNITDLEINKNIYLKMLSKVSSLPKHKRGYYLGEAFLRSIGYDPMDFEVVERDCAVGGTKYEYMVTNECVTLLVFVSSDSYEEDRRRLASDRETLGSRPVIIVCVDGEKIRVASKKFNQSFFVDVSLDDWDSIRMLFNPRLDKGLGDYFEQLEFNGTLELLSDFLDTGVPSHEILNALGVSDDDKFLKVFKSYREQRSKEKLSSASDNAVDLGDMVDADADDAGIVDAEAVGGVTRAHRDDEDDDLFGDDKSTYGAIPSVNKLDTKSKDPFSDPFEE